MKKLLMLGVVAGGFSLVGLSGTAEASHGRGGGCYGGGGYGYSRSFAPSYGYYGGRGYSYNRGFVGHNHHHHHGHGISRRGYYGYPRSGAFYGGRGFSIGIGF